MSYKVLVSKTFQQKFYRVEKLIQNKIRTALNELQKDPYTSRSTCDVKPLKDTKPKKYRLRIGDFRIIYIVEQQKIMILDLIKRGTGYNRLD
jgi:mRNA-degrading endonuclease RelE of RelBE toxin-antitoxin system